MLLLINKSIKLKRKKKSKIFKKASSKKSSNTNSTIPTKFIDFLGEETLQPMEM